jgi:hypothetical protein
MPLADGIHRNCKRHQPSAKYKSLIITLDVHQLLCAKVISSLYQEIAGIDVNFLFLPAVSMCIGCGSVGGGKPITG